MLLVLVRPSPPNSGGIETCRMVLRGGVVEVVKVNRSLKELDHVVVMPLGKGLQCIGNDGASEMKNGECDAKLTSSRWSLILSICKIASPCSFFQLVLEKKVVIKSNEPKKKKGAENNEKFNKGKDKIR